MTVTIDAMNLKVAAREAVLEALRHRKWDDEGALFEVPFGDFTAEVTDADGDGWEWSVNDDTGRLVDGTVESIELARHAACDAMAEVIADQVLKLVTGGAP